MWAIVVFGDKRKDSWVITGLSTLVLAEEVKDLLEAGTGKEVHVFACHVPAGTRDHVEFSRSTAQEIMHGWLQSGPLCGHVWTAGLCYVDDEDLDSVSADRQVSCQECGLTYVHSLAVAR